MHTLFLFGTPGKLGGAATKIRDLVRMLRADFDITVVLSQIEFFKSKEVSTFLNGLGIKYCLRKELPAKLDGVGLGICELDFFSSGFARELKARGLKIVWSNEMMWAFEGEQEAAAAGLVDRVLFLSEIQQKNFAQMYAKVPQLIIRNYIYPEDFPFVARANQTFCIGRLSRPDPVKYPLDFPVFYEELAVKDVRYRVQAWSDELGKFYRWHKFGPQWELLPEKKIPAAKFLQSLDLFVYPLGHRFIESWGRVVGEAMLTGAIPIVPTGHQFHNILVHEESGFIFNNFDECKRYVQELYRNNKLRKQISEKAAFHAKNVICNEDLHRRMWLDALTFR